jgi:hypothetical protein
MTMIKPRMMRWLEHVAHMGAIRNVCKILVGQPQGKRPLGRPGNRWEDNIKMGLRERGLEGVDWIHLAKDRNLWWSLVNLVMNLWVP